MMSFFIKPLKYFFLIILFTIIIFSAFYNLDVLSIQPWDESFFALRAFHFYKNNEFLKHFSQISSLAEFNFPNYKPNFMTFFQGITMHILGPTELALRIPISITFLLINIFFLYISRKIFNSLFPGIIAIIVFISFPGVNDYHMARFGDHEIPFCLFYLLFIYNSFKYLETQKQSFLFYSIIWFLVAFFTKSVAIFMALPPIFIYLIFNTNLKTFLFKRNNIIALFSIISIILIFFYLKTDHLHNFSRINKANNHPGDITFYFKTLIIEKRLFPWIFFIPFSFLNLKKSSLSTYIMLNIISIIIIITIAKSKLYWYAAPIYPLLALSIGIGIYYFLKLLFKEIMISKIISLMIVLIFSITPLISHFNNIITPIDYCYSCRLNYLLKTVLKEDNNLKQISIIRNDRTPNFIFYQKALLDLKNIDIKVFDDFKNINEFNIICYKDTFEKIDTSYFKTEIKKELNNAYFITIKPKNNQQQKNRED